MKKEILDWLSSIVFFSVFLWFMWLVTECKL